MSMEEKDEKVKIEASSIIDLFPDLPRLFVFDLDYTIWPCYCDYHEEGDTPSIFPEARGILYALKDRGVELAIASRSPTPNVAKAFLNKLGINFLFPTQEIFPSRTDKTDHFERVHTRTGVPYQSMIFFDDEYRNIVAVREMGVTCVFVDRGVTLDALRQGLTKFSGKRC